MLKNNIIILGHTSFIGSNLFNHFKNKKKYKVKGFNSKTLNLKKKSELKKLNNYINDNSIIIILSANKKQKGAGINVLKDNFKMYYNLFEYLKNNIPRQIIFVSSQVVFGENVNNLKTRENTKNIANSYYGLSKIIAENLIKITFKNSLNKFIVLRMPRIYGPNDNINNYGPTQFTFRAMRKQKINIWGSGKELREYIHINDIIKIFDKIVDSKINGTINIASGKPYSFVDIITVLQNLLNYKISYDHVKRTGTLVNHVFDNTNFKKYFKNYKFIDLNSGIKSLIEKNKFSKK